ncbi:concanavalin A-like lectin/glucanase [Clavulina sp. PMI_390]|nr:concanavalin A-like lectin/glucanase [Clavulina sp. PMI_390]
MKSTSFAALALAVAGAIASPIQADAVEERGLERRLDTSSHCGQWDTVAVGTEYILYLDQWGLSGGSGSDCASLTSYSGTTVAWKTTWSWTTGTGGVKSYTNIAVNTNLNKQLSAISTMQSTWTWSQSTSSVVADIAYDLFTSSSSGGSAAYEIMIWLANYNAGPISYTYSSSGAPTPVASSISIAGHTWNLYYGSNGSNLVYSFLPTSGTITSFSGDIKLFFTYLINNRGLSSAQYLTTAEAGTEATSGTSVTLTTSAYSFVIA